MGQKRPSDAIPADVLARAIVLRLDGKTWRAVAAEVGWSKSALHERLKDDLRLAGAAPTDEAVEEDQARADVTREALDETIAALKAGAQANLEALQAARNELNKATSREMTANEVAAYTGAVHRGVKDAIANAEKLVKVIHALERRPGSGRGGTSITVNANAAAAAAAAAGPTPEEARVLAALGGELPP